MTFFNEEGNDLQMHMIFTPESNLTEPTFALTKQ